MTQPAEQSQEVAAAHTGIYVGMPAALKLDLFGTVVQDVFGDPGWGVFLVGSAVLGKVWRDVDVRVILPDAEFEKWFGKEGTGSNAKWMAMCMAFAALGKEMTGLPIDFQIQSHTQANTLTRNKGPRQALGMGRHRTHAGGV